MISFLDNNNQFWNNFFCRKYHSGRSLVSFKYKIGFIPVEWIFPDLSLHWLFQTGRTRVMPGCETRWWAWWAGGSEEVTMVRVIMMGRPTRQQGAWEAASEMGAQQGKEARGPGERPPPPPPLAGRIGERQGGRIKGLRAPPPRWAVVPLLFLTWTF